jgi:hypothetical protein
MEPGSAYKTKRSVKAIHWLVVVALLSNCFLPTAYSQAQQPPGELVKVVYDQQKDVTQVTLNPFILVSRKREELRLGAITAYQGKVKTKPKEVALIFMSITTEDVNKYETARKLVASVDGERLVFGPAQRSKQAQNGLFLESLMIAVPTDDFLRICRAKAVTLKLGFTEVELSTAQITVLRAAASYMTE